MDCFVALLLAMTSKNLNVAPRSRGAISPEFCKNRFASLITEGAGNAGRSMHPQPRVRNKKAHEHSHHGHTGNHPAFPAQWFYGFAGIDVSLEYSSVCVVDASGKVVREAKVVSEPEALIGWFGSLGLRLARIGLEAGPLSQWLYAAMKQAGLAVELLETRHVSDAFKAMPVKSDRNDARKIAQLMRLGWFRPVHCKSIAAQEIRAMLTARKLLQSKLLDLENSLRGILRGFGLKVGKTTRTNFAGRIEELVKGHPNLQTIGQALLRARAVLLAEFNGFEKRVRAMSRLHDKARLLMSTPAVGPIVSLTFACAIDDPSRFTSSKQAGPHFGLTPKKYQSGETDYTGRISKHGCSELKSWAMRIARRAGTNKAKVALARKLAVIMLRMLKDNVPFNPAAKAATA